MSSTSSKKRLRVFAGPNGSGKTTIIKAIRNVRVNGRPIDFGVYVNADDIAALLTEDKFSFRRYGVTQVNRAEFIQLVASTGLVSPRFTIEEFSNCFTLKKDDSLILKNKARSERVAQILAEYLRWQLIEQGKKLSFETVFSHPSKLAFMEAAKVRGYRIYLYFVATEDPAINLARIKDIRIKRGGHDVPETKIKSRYLRSLEQLYDAAQLAYQAYFFDNSKTSQSIHAEPFAHFKIEKDNKKWDPIDTSKIPRWFVDNYSEKARK